MAQRNSGFVRYITVRDPEGSGLPTLTPVLLGVEHPVGFAPDWVYARPEDGGRYASLLASPTKKVIKKVHDLFDGLGIGVGDDVPAPGVLEDVLANVGTDRHGAEMLRAAFAGVDFGGCREDWAVGGEPRKALALTDGSRHDTVTFITGGCLGGAAGTVARTSSGTYPLVESASSAGLTERLFSVGFEPKEVLSFYERETTYRLAVTIAKLAGRLPGHKIRVRLDIPRTQYYLYTLDAHQKGLITSEACLAWFDQVDARNRMVMEHFRDVLHRMGVRADVSVTDELGMVREYLRQEYQADRRPALDEFVRIMRDGGDHLWGHVLDPQVREKTKVGPMDSVKAFNGAAYAIAVMREAEAGLTLEVDDPLERPILQAAERFAKPLLGKLRACAVYPQSRLYPRTDGVTRTFHLYRDDPGHLVRVNDPHGLTELPHGEQIVIDDLLPMIYPL